MKKYISFIIIIVSFPAWSMENMMTKKFSFIRKAMNKDFTQKTTLYKNDVCQEIQALKIANIIECKEYRYNQDSKLDIIHQFFTTYPNQIYPELKKIIKNINNSFNRKDFITLLPKLKTQTKNYSLKDYLIANLIELTEKKTINFNDHEIKLFNACWEIMYHNQESHYLKVIEETSKMINLENAKAKVKTTVAKIRSQEEKSTIYDLEQYKDELEELIAHLEGQQTSQNILDQYQATITNVTQRIEFLTKKQKV